MARTIKERPSDDTFEKALEWLQNGGTKKGACEILGVGNNKTMEKWIEDWTIEKETEARIRKEKRGKPVTSDELVLMISAYLDGDSLDEMSKRFYRSTQLIKRKLEESGALLRERAHVSPLNPPMLPDECFNDSEEFQCRETHSGEFKSELEYDTWKKQLELSGRVIEVYKKAGKWDGKRAIHVRGELVWLPGYQCIGEVITKVPSKRGTAYRVMVLDPDRQRNICVPFYDMGSLRHLQELGVDVESLGRAYTGLECTEQLNKALAAARKSKK